MSRWRKLKFAAPGIINTAISHRKMPRRRVPRCDEKAPTIPISQRFRRKSHSQAQARASPSHLGRQRGPRGHSWPRSINFPRPPNRNWPTCPSAKDRQFRRHLLPGCLRRKNFILPAVTSPRQPAGMAPVVAAVVPLDHAAKDCSPSAMATGILECGQVNGIWAPIISPPKSI